MLSNFKKLGVAAAVAASLGASGAAQAVILGQPGDALLIPHVIFDSEAGLNTLIGVVVGGNNAGAANVSGNPLAALPGVRQLPGTNLSADNGFWAAYFPDDNVSVDANGVRTPRNCAVTRPDGGAGARPLLHWYFFNSRSAKVKDGRIGVTCEDFVRFDWGFLGGDLDGVPGYLVIADEDASITNGAQGSRFALYGQSYLVKGIFQSMAFIPVLPLSDLADATNGADAAGRTTIVGLDDVFYGADTFPEVVVPVSAGMGLATSTPAVAGAVPAFPGSLFSLRYFIDPALEAGTAFVIWLPSNGSCAEGGPRNVGVDVYDADEIYVSQRVCLKDQLNILAAADISGTINNSALPGPGFPAGHEIPDFTNPPGLDPINSGFVLFRLRDSITDLGPNQDFVRADFARAGVAFSLISIGSIDNRAQVQTELAHERGLF
jgi:hypothetical protein